MFNSISTVNVNALFFINLSVWDFKQYSFKKFY
nr:MAG TPA: hypothetical protein [Caudoviricetes sp.]